MSAGRRFEFLKWANTHKSWLVEDDYDSEYRYAGQPIPALASLDKYQRTLYIGTFSKVLTRSLRLGYLVVPPQLIQEVASSIHNRGNRASLLGQRPLGHFMQKGDFHRHLRRSRRIYAQRQKLFVELVQEQLADFGRLQAEQAGMQSVFYLSHSWADKQLEKLARTQGLGIRALSGFASNPKEWQGFVLGYCGHDEIELQEGISRLKKLLVSTDDML
ncbi:aminotransferase-like domain-containing protein [Dongshaea marina]|uniref:aminotransferase-like domain-containing protein n=1 Tax=Dongshaea marina TaxID=2047966 RepID=UPI000D3ED536|nr:PLP-dependent aminotransferase family protein [Dongshaea marina]